MKEKTMRAGNWMRFGLAGAAAALMLAPLASGQTTGGPYQYYTVAPCRLVDSRFNQGATVLVGPVIQNITTKTQCGVPATAKAVALNVTVVGASAGGFVELWATGTPIPGTSNLNFNAGEPALANGAIVSLGASTPDLSVVCNGGVTTHFIIDIVGYFQ
jgi:hypothetical protein